MLIEESIEGTVVTQRDIEFLDPCRAQAHVRAELLDPSEWTQLR
jgi:hypothetical protein